MNTRLTKCEREIMQMFWSIDHPVTPPEIISKSENRSWKERSVFSMVHSLLQKGLIREVGLVRSGKTYARTLEAAMTRADYFATVVSEALTQEEYPAFLAALLKSVEDQPMMLAALRQALEEWEEPEE